MKQDAIAVPYAALLERAGATIAFVANPVEGESGQYVLERRDVDIGVSTPSQVEVKDGIEPGELVVVGNLALLRDGLSVMVEQETEPPATETDTDQDDGQPEDAQAADPASDAAPAQEQPAEEASAERS